MDSGEIRKDFEIELRELQKKHQDRAVLIDELSSALMSLMVAYDAVVEVGFESLDRSLQELCVRYRNEAKRAFRLVCKPY